MHTLDPLQDARWAEFVRRHGRGSVFHTPGWLRALAEVYAYEPVACTTSPPGAELQDGLVLCRVRSRLTGRRLVSLPFSDHCDILAEEPAARAHLLEALASEHAAGGWRYAELRPREPLAQSESAPAAGKPEHGEGAAAAGVHGFRPAQQFCFQELDLEGDLDAIHRRLHKDSIQRKIRRAGREGVACRAGNSPELLRAFYGLQIATRRRQHLPPQPLRWFQAIVAGLGEAAQVRVAYKEGRPIAAILTLTFGRTMVYKYGASDARMHPVGATPMLFWEAIREARERGLSRLDLGRSDWSNPGLIEFKKHLGAEPVPLTYWRVGEQPGRRTLAAPAWLARQAVRYAPRPLLVAAGGLLYRHMG